MDLLQLEHFLAVVEEAWDSKAIHTSRRNATAASRAAAGLKSPRSA
jgi:hypothetical protein